MHTKNSSLQPDALEAYFPVWDALTTAQKEKIKRSAGKRMVKKGTLVHGAGTECTGFLLVQKGQLRAYIMSEEGREITLYRLLDRDVCLFSASCIMRSIQLDILIEAEKDTKLWIIPAEVYKGLMEESAPVAAFTNEIMASRFSDVMWLMEQVLWKSFDKRLAGFLLEESLLEGSDELKLTHESIGNHLGNPREVVTRMLRYFQNEGMVKISRGTVTITDREKLQGI